MSANIRLVEQRLRLADGMKAEGDAQRAAERIVPGCRVSLYGDLDGGCVEVSDGEGEVWPNGNYWNGIEDDVAELVGAFGSGSFITFLDEDDFVFVDVWNDHGKVVTRYLNPGREDLFPEP